MSNGLRVTRKSIIELIICVLALYIVEIPWYAEKNYNMGIWSLVHGNVEGFFSGVFSLLDVIIIIAFALVLLILDNLVVARERKAIRVAADAVALVLALIAIGTTMVKAAGIYAIQNDIARARELLVNQGAVIHAGGQIEDSQGNIYTYTNSFDALSNAYDKGNRIIEIDFTKLADGNVVCAHDSTDNISKFGFELMSEDVNLEQFLNAKVDRTFSTMSLDELCAFMREHKDLIIVTDVKGDNNIETCELISEAYPDLADRFYIQMYHPNEFQPIWDMGFHHIIYTMYCANKDEKEPYSLNETCKLYDIMALTYWNGWMNGDEYASVLQENIPKCEHTVNDLEKMKEDFANGIDVIYTDNVDNDWMRE